MATKTSVLKKSLDPHNRGSLSTRCFDFCTVLTIILFLSFLPKAAHAQQCTVTGGIVATTSPTNNICLNDGSNHPVLLTVSGNSGIGRFGLVETSSGNVVAVNTSGLFEMTSYPPGNYQAGHVSVQQVSILTGVTNINQLMGCYDLSNVIAISSFWVEGGTISFVETPVSTNNFECEVTGASGPNIRWALLNGTGSEVLAIQTTGIFDLSDYPFGTYRIVHASFGPGIALNNIDPQNLEGCIDASNILTVEKNPIPFDCPELAANIGSPCDDGNPGTVDDVVTEACECIGNSPCGELPPNTVCNPTTGRIWMDRNLGASQVATSPTDAAAYGAFYQWGRPTTAFTPAPNDPYDWSVPQNNNYWQGVDGLNNPCPAGFRIPTNAEWNEERLSWSSNNKVGAFASPLKLPTAGGRLGNDGRLLGRGSLGFYWSSTVSDDRSRRLGFGSSSASMGDYYRAFGGSVRCLKD